jgi:hypothetical protein
MDALPTNAEAATEPAPAEIPIPTRTVALPYTFAQVRLKVGDQVHLEPPRIAGGRASVMVLGWLEGQSVIVTAPQNDAGRLVLQEGEPVLMRAFTGKSAFAFRATVLKAAYIPFHYVHLSFPDKVEGVEIRSSPRCRLRLPAAITAGGKAAGQGNILNIGTSGALIETAGPLGQDEGLIQIAFSLELHGVTVSLDLRAQVCGAKSAAARDGTTPRHQYGVEFRNLQPNDRLILGSLVWYQMYEHPRSVA